MAERTWHSYKQRAPIERFDAIVVTNAGSSQFSGPLRTATG